MSRKMFDKTGGTYQDHIKPDIRIDLDFLFVENRNGVCDFNSALINSFPLLKLDNQKPLQICLVTKKVDIADPIEETIYIVMECYDRTFLQIKNFLIERLKLNETLFNISIQSQESFLNNLSDETIFFTLNKTLTEIVNLNRRLHPVPNKNSLFHLKQLSGDSQSSHYKDKTNTNSKKKYALAVTITGETIQMEVSDDELDQPSTTVGLFAKKERHKTVSFIIEEGKDYKSKPCRSRMHAPI